MMSTIICGSRNVLDSREVVQAMQQAMKAWGESITEVVSGGASGPDTIAATLAKAHKIPLKIFPAPWNSNDPLTGRPYGRRAGIIRNGQMLDYIKTRPNPGVIAIWDGKSRGTQHMITAANNAGVRVHIHTAKTEYQVPVEA